MPEHEEANEDDDDDYVQDHFTDDDDYCINDAIFDNTKNIGSSVSLHFK